MIKSADEVKAEFLKLGISVSGWARSHGYSSALVYQILSGQRKSLRGESHNIAVELGIKQGTINKDFTRSVLLSQQVGVNKM